MLVWGRASAMAASRLGYDVGHTAVCWKLATRGSEHAEGNSFSM